MVRCSTCKAVERRRMLFFLCIYLPTLLFSFCSKSSFSYILVQLTMGLEIFQALGLLAFHFPSGF